MTEDIKVSMFGSFSALLINQLAESTGNQEGFLVGSRVRRQYRMNSDSSSNLDKQWTQVHLSTMLPLRGQSVYQPSGAGWKNEACEQFLKSCDPDKQIVGFYQLKKTDIITSSLKDRRLMAAARNVFPEPFIYLVIGESVAETRATYKYSSAAYIANNKPAPVVIEVLNLGKDEEMKYMSAPRGNSTELSHILMVDNWPEQVKAMEMVVDRFEHIHKEVVEQAERTKEELLEAEKERKRMEEEVRELRRKLDAGRKLTRMEILAGDLIDALKVVEDPVKEGSDSDDEMPLVSLIRVKNDGEEVTMKPNQEGKEEMEEDH